MNLLSELGQAYNVLHRCEGSAEIQRARMNFIINLVTILELFSKKLFNSSTADRSLDCDSLPLSIILHVVGTKEDEYLVSKLVQLRNEIVHEGKSTSLGYDEILAFYALVKKIISQTNKIL